MAMGWEAGWGRREVAADWTGLVKALRSDWLGAGRRVGRRLDSGPARLAGLLDVDRLGGPGELAEEFGVGAPESWEAPRRRGHCARHDGTSRRGAELRSDCGWERAVTPRGVLKRVSRARAGGGGGR